MLKDNRGAAAIIVAIMLPVLMGFLALVVDMGYGYWTRTKLQHTADAAALAGAGTLEATGMVYRDTATRYSRLNMPVARHGTVLMDSDVIPGRWDVLTRTFTPDTSEDRDAVQVTTRRAQVNGNPVETFLAGIMGMDQMNINTAATAHNRIRIEKNCLISLDPTADQSLHIQGTASITSDGCGICVNSNSPDGLWLNGTPDVYIDAAGLSVNADDYHQVGAVDLFPSPTLNGGSCTDPFAEDEPFVAEFESADFCPDNADPWMLTGPDYPIVIPAGVHCGGIRFMATGDVTFAPGIHIIKNGTLEERGSHSFVGYDVTFLLDNATVDFAGSNSTDFTGGANGSEFLFYENPNGLHPDEEHIFRGDAEAYYEGIIYMPDRDVKFVGNSAGGTGPSDCLALIANTFEFTGTTDIKLSGDTCGTEVVHKSLRLVN